MLFHPRSAGTRWRIRIDPVREGALIPHPVFAYELFYPVEYLRACLAIPYAHHEKWDGTGYPQGLKGEQIPLPARLFAVVDLFFQSQKGSARLST